VQERKLGFSAEIAFISVSCDHLR